MSKYWQHDKPDSNAAEIIAFLRQHGIEIIKIGQPLDTLIWNRRGKEKLCGWMEIKTLSRNARYTRPQLEFISETDMPVAFIKSEGEALIYAESMEGLDRRAKDSLASLLVRNPGVKTFTPAQIERAINLC